MRILYGVQGTGNGHISRARMMARHFTLRGSKVDYLFSGRDPERYFDMQCFGDYQTRTGLSFVTSNGAISYLRTLLASRPINFLREIRELDVSGYDFIVTDFEPVTAWAAKLAGKSVIGIGHQYAFSHADVPASPRYLLSRIVLRSFAPASIGLGLHWSDFGAAIVPPIINPDVRGQPGDAVLVYLPFEEQDKVTELLNRLPGTSFIQYSPDVRDSKIGNVSRHKANLKGFKHDLQSCKAVICNAGFELISECLHLGKPVLAKPVHGQGEQEANALALTQLGYADVMRHLSTQQIERWLRCLPSPRPIPYPDVAQALVHWVLSEQRIPPEKLSAELWEKTRLA